MAITVGTDSYVDQATADAYMANRLHAEAWEAADAAQREAALKMATKRIDMQRLVGLKKEHDQVLQFPRCYRATDKQTYFLHAIIRDPLADHGFVSRFGYLCDADVPQAVKDACCEEALELLQVTDAERQRMRDQRMGIVGRSIGDASEYAQQSYIQTLINRGQKLESPVARQLMAPYIAQSAVIA